MCEATGKKSDIPEDKRKVCPECGGKKVIDGACVCDMEWRGTEREGEWEDCHCAPEKSCPTCMGRGFVHA